MATVDAAPETGTALGRALTANSALAFVIAALVNDTTHELAHAVAALSLGLTPTIGPFSVDFADTGVSATHQIVVALAGPVFSLVMGLVLMRLARSWGRGLVRLFWMWLPFMGVMNFVGYCFIAPIARGGDTGQALTLMKAAFWVFLLVALAGAGGFVLLARRFAVEVKRYASDLQEERRLGYYPWLIGTPIIIVITLVEIALDGVGGAELFLVASYGFAVGVFAPMQFIFRTKVSNTYERLQLQPVNLAGSITAVVLTAALIALAGVHGLRL